MVTPNFLFGYQEYLLRSTFSVVPHMNQVSVSPTNGNGPTQGHRKTLTGVGIEPTTFGLDYRCSTD